MKQVPGTKVIQCTLSRQKPVKAAVVVFGDNLEVIHDPQLVTENVAAVFIIAGRLKLGVVSVYFEGDQEINPYLRTTKEFCNSLDTNNVLVGGDVNAWSQWWGSNSENRRGEDYNTFLNEMDFQILNIGNTPTFETYRRGRLYSSIVDVTACSQPLLGKIEDWRVDRSLTTSDHNAITFKMRLEKALEPLRPISTRIYNTKKAKWSDFAANLKLRLAESNITPEYVSEIPCAEKLEECVTTYTDTIHGSCENAIPKVRPWKGVVKPPWWDPSLEELKRDVIRKKRRIRNAAPRRRQYVVEEYVEARDAYRERTKEAATTSWKEFCSTQSRESMWDGIYRVIRKVTKRQEENLLRDSAGKTLSPQESAELLARTFYPDDSEETDLECHRDVRRRTDENYLEEERRLSADDPPFTSTELEVVLRDLNPKKAPGPDGLTADICWAAIRCDGGVFLALANKCLALAHFPEQWKVAHVCIIRKPGKEDYTHPKSYRPIGLLSVLGKILEKLLVRRLQWRILPTLHPSQYGFVPQRGTEDALYDLIAHIRKEIKSKKLVLVVSLDIEGAFDNAWWPVLKQQLINKKCPQNLFALIGSYLKDRRIKVNYARASSEKGTTKGCVQGSIGGPTFWNLILDSLLTMMANSGIYCQAFADDVVLVFSDHAVSALQREASTTLDTVHQWGIQNKLNFAAHKTNVMLITRKLKYENPEVFMSGTRLNLVKEIKLLGLVIDCKLTFNAHVTATCKKAANIYKQLACAAKVSWGLNTEIIKTIYVAVIEPIVLYAASVWSPAVEKLMVRKQLNSLQRGFAQKICKSYRTVSLTSALILAGQLPLDLRVQEAATLFKIKKGYTEDFLPPGREVESAVGYLQNPHPSELTPTEYERLDDLEPETLNSLQVKGPQIYTDGSKIEGKVGAALTWWSEGRETKYSTFRLESHNTVFQSELYALYRAIKMVRQSKERLVNILSDSRSSLDLLANPSVTHHLALEIKNLVREIRAEGRDVRLFWLRAHVGTPGNERADGLAKKAALTKRTAPDYSNVPISYVRRQIREATVQKWQARYEESTTGMVTKAFLPTVSMARRVLKDVKLTPIHVQAMTGHGGFAAYLYKFKIKDSPSCICDPDKEETIWHLLFECPRFGRERLNLEIKIQNELAKSTVPNIMDQSSSRKPFLDFVTKVVSVAAIRNGSTIIKPIICSTVHRGRGDPHSSITQDTPEQVAPRTAYHSPSRTPEEEPERAIDRSGPLEHLMASAEGGEPGIRIRGVALFMDGPTERLGICYFREESGNRVTISPGLAKLLKGSTDNISIKCRKINALPVETVEGRLCRIMQVKQKTIVLFKQSSETAFAQVSAVLTLMGEASSDTDHIPRKVSVDAMVLGIERGKVADRYGCLIASEQHEVVVYEDRGENLSFLKVPRQDEAIATSPMNVESMPCIQSGSERLQERLADARAVQRQLQDAAVRREKSELRRQCNILTEAILTKHARFTIQDRQIAAAFLRESPRNFGAQEPRPTRTKAQKGQVSPPSLIPVTSARDHAVNAFLEFQAVTKATRLVNLAICKDILQPTCQSRLNLSLLDGKLEEAGAAIYNNDNGQIIKGVMSGRYMAAYSASGGFVALDEGETRRTQRLKFSTPAGDPVVVTARCTRIMLDDRVLEMMNIISGESAVGRCWESWVMPKFTWVNGVPGCGKTARVVGIFDENNDLIVTTTVEAAKELRSKLAHKVKGHANKKVRTMASVLANGVQGRGCYRLMVDEALMNHFGAIIMAARLSEAREVVLFGDVNQLPYIDRENLFEMQYHRPHQTVSIGEELSCTHRCPMDVAFALKDVYSGMYSASSRVRSLELVGYSEAAIPKDQPNTLYLVHTQEEKGSLTTQGFGSGQGSRVLTIHEAQGLTSERVYIIQTNPFRLRLHESIPHAVVALSRHTNTCVYVTDHSDDAIGRFIEKAMAATSERIREHNLGMAMSHRDMTIVDEMLAS